LVKQLRNAIWTTFMSRLAHDIEKMAEPLSSHQQVSKYPRY